MHFKPTENTLYRKDIAKHTVKIRPVQSVNNRLFICFGIDFRTEKNIDFRAEENNDFGNGIFTGIRKEIYKRIGIGINMNTNIEINTERIAGINYESNIELNIQFGTGINI